jgi:hypothetical protein
MLHVVLITNNKQTSVGYNMTIYRYLRNLKKIHHLGWIRKKSFMCFQIILIVNPFVRWNEILIEFWTPTNLLCQAKRLKTIYWNSFYYMESIDTKESFLDGRMVVNQPISRSFLISQWSLTPFSQIQKLKCKQIKFWTKI